MSLPIDRSTLALAQGNQVPYQVAASAKNINFLKVVADTIDELNVKVDAHAASALLPHTDASVSTAKIADAAVTTVKIAPLAVTTAKIAAGAVGAAQLDPTLLTNYGDIAVQAEFDRRGLNVMKYSNLVVGGDWTAAINTAFAAGNTYFPPGTYLIDAEVYLNIPSNRTIEWATGAVLVMKPTTNAKYRFLRLRGVSNVTLINPTIIGDRTAGKLPSLVFDGYGIFIVNGCQNITIINPKISNCYADGIIIGTENDTYTDNNMDITIFNPIIDNCCRNGMAILGVENCNIYNPKCTNTNGTTPGAGIDFEPTYPADYLKNVNVWGGEFSGNTNWGIVLGLQFKNDVYSNINIYNPVFKNNGVSGIGCVDYKTNTLGRVYVENPYSYGSALLRHQSCTSGGMELIIKDPVIENWKNGRTTHYGAGILIYADTGDTGVSCGGVKVTNPKFRLSGGDTAEYAIAVKDLRGSPVDLSDIEISNPTYPTSGLTNHYSLANLGATVKVSDSYMFTDVDWNSADGRFNVQHTNNAANFSQAVRSTEPQIDGIEYTFINHTSKQCDLAFYASGSPTTYKVYPYFPNAISGLRTLQQGASLRWKYTETDGIRITSMVGDWVASVQAAQALVNFSNILNRGLKFTRVTETSNVTGLFMQVGIFKGQQITVINESAFTITFAAASNIVGGTSEVIAATSARSYIWDDSTALWYPIK